MEDVEQRGGASGAWRSVMDKARDRPGAPTARDGSAPESVVDGPPAPKRRPGIQPEEWVRVDDLDLEREAEGAVSRSRKGSTSSRRPAPGRPIESDNDNETIEGSVRDELTRAVGANRVERYEQRLKDASRAFEAERFADAARILKKLTDDAPSASAVRELYGLTLYRMGRWRPAAKELEAFRLLSDSTEQHPVLADTYRALGQHALVEELWEELKAASPNADLVTEGRIVMAGSLSDQRQIRQAVTLLEQGFSFPKRPKVHHLRRAYALADAYERAGDVVRARELFGRIRAHDPMFADVRGRERALN